MKQSYSKSELAALADVSYSTFYRYLNSRRKQLSKLGICSERNNQGCYYRLYEMTPDESQRTLSQDEACNECNEEIQIPF